MPFTKETASIAGKKGGRPKGLFAEKFRDYCDTEGYKRLLGWCASDKFAVAFPAIKFVFEMGYGKAPGFDAALFSTQLQKTVNEVQALKLIFELNGKNYSDPGKLASGVAPVQAPSQTV